MSRNLIFILSVALFVSSCAKKNTASRLGSGSGSVQTQSGNNNQTIEQQQQKQAQQDEKNQSAQSEAEKQAAAEAAAKKAAEEEAAQKSAEAKAAQEQSGVGATSATTTTTLPSNNQTSKASGSNSSSNINVQVTEVESAAGDNQKESGDDVPVISGDDEEGPGSAGSGAGSSQVEVSASSLGYSQSNLKLLKGKNLIRQVLSLGYSSSNELIDSVTYCFNGDSKSLESIQETQFFLMPGSQMVAQERIASGDKDFTLTSCEALADSKKKNFLQLFKNIRGSELEKKLTEAQKNYLNTLDFIDLNAGDESHIEFISSDGSNKEAIQTSIVCVENLKSKKQMKEDVTQDKKVKNRITLSAGSMLYFNRPMEAKDEKGRVLKSLAELNGKSRVVISCKK